MDIYLVYYYQGQLKTVRCFWDENVLRPFDNPKKYYTKYSYRPLNFRWGKVWCYERDLPRAIEILKTHRQGYIDSLEQRYHKLKGDTL